jgi:hypothetical protein
MEQDWRFHFSISTLVHFHRLSVASCAQQPLLILEDLYRTALKTFCLRLHYYQSLVYGCELVYSIRKGAESRPGKGRPVRQMPCLVAFVGNFLYPLQ